MMPRMIALMAATAALAHAGAASAAPPAQQPTITVVSENIECTADWVNHKAKLTCHQDIARLYWTPYPSLERRR
jgi:ABC-type nitrate/sulfonate/bicarbonate transport system substrate-binding protein